MHHIFVLHWFSNAYDLLSTYKNVILNLQISRSYVKFVCDVCIVITTSNALRHGSHSLPANDTMPAFTPQQQSITAVWLVLILPSHRG